MGSIDHTSEARLGPSFVLYLIWTFVVVARPQDHLSFLLPLRPVLVISIITLIAMFFERPGQHRSIFSSTEVKLVCVLYLIMLAGVPMAAHRGVAFEFVLVGVPSVLLYFAATVLQVNSIRRLNALMAVLALSLLFAAAFYAADALGQRGVRVSAGLAYDPNDIAMVLTTFIPMGLYIFFGPFGFKMKAVSVAGILLAAAGIMLSGSRGGVLALATVVTVFLLSRAPHIRTAARVGIVAVLALVFINYFAVVEGRFENFGEDYNFKDETGRLHIWKQNLAIIAQNPILGTGVGCSTISLGLHRAEVGGTQAWQTSHSSVFQYAVDNGIPGFIIYVILNIIAIANVRRIRRDRGHPLANAAFFVELSFYGFWAGGLLLSHAYSVNLFLLLGISAALRFLYERKDLGTQPETIN